MPGSGYLSVTFCMEIEHFYSLPGIFLYCAFDPVPRSNASTAGYFHILIKKSVPMKTPIIKLCLVCAAVLCILSTPLPAQDIPQALDEAVRALRTGKYEDARELFRPFLDTLQGEDREAAMGYFETFIAVGDYSEGLQEVERMFEDSPDDPYLLNMYGRFLAETGRMGEAVDAFMRSREQQYDYWRNTIDLAGILKKTGRKRDAASLYNQVYFQYRAGDFRDAGNLSLAAVAAAGIGGFHDANQAFRTAHQLDPENIDNLYRWACLFYEKFNNADAQRTFEEAASVNPRNADLYTGLARTSGSFSTMEMLAQRAIEVNPNHVEAMNILAELNILDTRYDEAESMLKKAVEINPSSLRTLANLASVYHFREDMGGYSAIEQRAFAVNNQCGEFYNVLAENCANRFRYRDAVDFSFNAVARERDNWRAYSLLGSNLLRIGRVDEAKRYLGWAFDRDAFDLFAKNNLDLIDEYEHFDVLESEHFILKIHESESGVLGNAVLELSEQAYTAFSNRYPYRPAGKILLEAYNNHADFAVRIAGISNLDLLGVCFGDIVAFNTPKSEEERSYNWARTLWHELAHVMSLGISNHRVPRWLTEGLAVYEEKLARPEWGREMDIELFTALESGALPEIGALDRGFTRPKFPDQVLLSYYQSSKLVEYIAGTYGFPAIISLLTEFSARKSMDDSFVNVLGKTPEEIDSDFFTWLDEQKNKVKDVIGGLQLQAGKIEEEQTIVQRLFGGSGSRYFSTLNEGVRLFAEKDFEAAEMKFLDALEIYPEYTGINNPYAGLAEIYRDRGDNEKLTGILVRYMSIAEHGEGPARELAAYYTESGNFDKAVYYHERLFHLDPYDAAAHTRLAELYKEHLIFGEEAEQRRIIVALEPLDRSKALYNLALSLYNDGRIGDAKKEVLRALELAPGYRDAQKLLLKCIGSGGD